MWGTHRFSRMESERSNLLPSSVIHLFLFLLSRLPIAMFSDQLKPAYVDSNISHYGAGAKLAAFDLARELLVFTATRNQENAHLLRMCQVGVAICLFAHIS